MGVCPFMNPEEIIFGKNSVLSFLEATFSQPEPQKEGKALFEAQVTDALAKLKMQIGEAAITSKDLDEIARLSRLPTVRINKILIAQGVKPDERIDRIWHIARQLKIPVSQVDRQKLDQLAGKEAHHQGVVAYVSSAELWSMETFLLKYKLDQALAEHVGASLNGYAVAVLDGIEDPHNLGAIIRSAEAAGLKALFIPQRRGAQLTGVVAKVSAGALANLPVVRVVNIVQALEILKKNGFWVAGLDVDAPKYYYDADLRQQLAIVIGSEGGGMNRLTKEHCDFLVKIPLLGKAESLNASVAAGIMFYEVVRQNYLASRI
jgi:23S rRNA (guanosine2251-2'-O)-methyltransferase